MPTTAKSTRSEELTAQSQLVRTVEANLKIVTLEGPTETAFRQSLLNCVSNQLATMPGGLITRLYESACEAKFPTPPVTAFREALQRQIGARHNLRTYRSTPARAGK